MVLRCLALMARGSSHSSYGCRLGVVVVVVVVVVGHLISLAGGWGEGYNSWLS